MIRWSIVHFDLFFLEFQKLNAIIFLRMFIWCIEFNCYCFLIDIDFLVIA